MSFGDTIFLFLLALILFGPKKLPEIARLVGKYMNQFRRASNEFRSQIEQEFALMETRERHPVYSPSAPLPGTASRSFSSEPSESSPAGTNAVEVREPAKPPATAVPGPAATAAVESNDEPLFASNGNPSHSGNNAGSATSAPPAADAAAAPVISNSPQESHV